jgi:hypothetical protein
MKNPQKLSQMAQNAKSISQPLAAKKIIEESVNL